MLSNQNKILKFVFLYFLFIQIFCLNQMSTIVGVDHVSSVKMGVSCHVIVSFTGHMACQCQVIQMFHGVLTIDTQQSNTLANQHSHILAHFTHTSKHTSQRVTFCTEVILSSAVVDISWLVVTFVHQLLCYRTIKL